MSVDVIELQEGDAFTVNSKSYTPLETELFNRLYDYIESLEPVEVTKAEPEDQGK